MLLTLEKFKLFCHDYISHTSPNFNNVLNSQDRMKTSVKYREFQGVYNVIYLDNIGFR